MRNPYFYAKVLWESERPEEGLAALNTYLESQLRQPVFRPPTRIFKKPLSWERAFIVLFCNSDSLVAPFGRVFPLIWKLNPSLSTIVMLQGQDFSRTPDIPDYLAEIEGLTEFDVHHTAQDFQRLASVLIQSASTGLLRPDPAEGRSTGVAFLTIDSIKEASPATWEPLRSLLLAQLPAAYDACPPDFWHMQARHDSLHLVTRFLHHVFGENHPTVETSMMSIERIITLAPNYKEVVVLALREVIQSCHIETLNDIVHFDANLPQVVDSYRWLNMLLNSVDAGDLGPLKQEMSQLRA